MIKNGKNNGRPWLIAFIIGLAVYTYFRMNATIDRPEEMTALAFMRAVDAGEIGDSVVRVVNRDEGVTFISGERKTGDGAKTAFRVNLVPGENEKLMETLREKGVGVDVRLESGAISPFVMNLLFFIGFMALFYWFVGRRMGGSGGPFGMGKSRAKILTGKEEKCKVTFRDVAGIDEAKEEVQEIVEFLKEPARFQKLGGRIPKGVLLVGPPGTGKTLLARAIAGEAKVPFFSMSGSDFEEMFVGVGASRMRDMFAEAKRMAPCIVFIDEIDSIGMKRSGAGALTGSHAYEQTLNTMLVEMDGFDANEGVIVIAATNRPDTLDSALLRPGRFDRQVVIDLPTLKGREDILALHGKKISFAEGVDLKKVARGTPGFSGADLANLLNEAALMATRKKLDGVDMATLDEARDKVLWGRERKSAGFSKENREITAWHESGHALLQLLLENTDPLHKVTIIPRGRALGSTMSLPEGDVLNRTRAQFLDELVVLCGGRIAEQMHSGDISTGAAQDIAMATDTARKMVCAYGMSDRFGFQAFKGQSALQQGDMPPPVSEQTSREIDMEVGRLSREAYERASKLLSRNRGKLEKLAAALLERETMDGDEVKALVEEEDG